MKAPATPPGRQEADRSPLSLTLPTPAAPAVVYPGDCRDLMALVPENSIDAMVCDPPYEIEFMLQKWDASGVAFSVDTWKEAYRILKPGGYLLAFGAARTYHRLVCAIEDAGFEIRDSCHWVYSSGMPKSLDVSKAIDRARNDYEDACKVALWLRPHVERVGFAGVSRHFGFKDETMARTRWTTRSQPQVPKWEQWEALKTLCGFGDDMDAEVWRLNGRKGTPGEAWNEREVLGNREMMPVSTKFTAGYNAPDYSEAKRLVNITGPALEAAKRWEGWGTNLKPAHEPVCIARKPMPGTVAENVQAWGTGALNIDGCRIPGGQDYEQTARANPHAFGGSNVFPSDDLKPGFTPASGRWPANLILSESAAEALDRQSEDGAASRFFQVFDYDDSDFGDDYYPFRYVPKPSQDERHEGTNGGNFHLTVKPVALMQWFCRLVTPPGGIVCDPFAGSGTTGVGARREGFLFVGMDIAPENVRTATARIAAAESTVEAELLRRRGGRPKAPKPAPPGQNTLDFLEI